MIGQAHSATSLPMCVYEYKTVLSEGVIFSQRLKDITARHAFHCKIKVMQDAQV